MTFIRDKFYTKVSDTYPGIIAVSSIKVLK